MKIHTPDSASLSSLFILITSLVVMTSCEINVHHTVIGSGEPETMEVDLPSFSGISVTGTCDVEIQIGQPQRVELSAQPEILDVMTTRIRNGILEIGFERDVTVNTEREIRAEIVVPALDYVGVTGAGDFLLMGAAQELLDVVITGSGNVDGYGMPVDQCFVTISGAGNCKLEVYELLDVKISGMGNVFYRGNPVLATDISGLGNIVNSNP